MTAQMEAQLVQLQACMYQYSRAIYRSIKDLIDPYAEAEVQLESRRSVLEQCRDLQRTSARLRAHGYVGLSVVQRHAGHGDLFDTLMVFQNAPRGSVQDVVRSPEGVEFVPVEMESLTHYPLVVVPFLYDDDLVVTQGGGDLVAPGADRQLLGIAQLRHEPAPTLDLLRRQLPGPAVRAARGSATSGWGHSADPGERWGDRGGRAC